MKKNIISGLLYIIIILIFCIDIHTNNPVFFMWLCFMAGYTKNIWDFDKYLAKQRFDDTESKNELVHNLLEELNFKKIKGGNLSELKVQKELKDNIKLLKDIAEKYREQDSSVPAGGFSGANSSTMSSSRSGQPVLWEFNGSHGNGTDSIPFLVQIKIGGGLDYKINTALVEVASQFLKKYTFKSDLGTSYVTTTSGTNWSSAILTAPTDRKQYTTIRTLEN